jgi:hypothetical protein
VNGTGSGTCALMDFDISSVWTFGSYYRNISNGSIFVSKSRRGCIVRCLLH